MSKESFLETLGLTKNEIKIYLSLLKIGSTTTSKIIKDVGINASKVYENLERLLKKGLVSYVIVKNKKQWNAEDPSKINVFLDEEISEINKKKIESEKIIEELRTMQKISFSETEYKVYEGLKGIKTAREHALNILKKGDTFYLVLSSYFGDDRLNAYWDDFQERRAKKGIKYAGIFNELLREIGRERKHLKNSKVKFVKSKYLSPTWIEIYGEYVGIGTMGSKPAIFVIKNEKVAEGFLAYFETLWNSK